MPAGSALILDANLKQALIATRSLGARGIDVTVGSPRRWTATQFSKHASKVFQYPSPAVDPDEFIRVVTAELRQSEYDMLLPINERTVEVVLQNRETLSALTNIPFPPMETVCFGLNKRKTIEAARKYGVTHPETVFLENSPIHVAHDRFEYPVVVKPVRGEGRSGVSICESYESLRNRVQNTSQRDPPVMVQEYIPNGGERGVYTLYDWSSNLSAATVQRRIRTKPPEGGASTFRETVEDDELISRTDRFLSGLNWQGVAMAEFRIDSRTGEPNLMEINPRLWGSLALSVFAEVDFPYMQYQLATSTEIPQETSYLCGVQARCLFTDFIQVWQRNDRFRAMREFATPSSKPCCYDVISKDDPLPALGQLLHWSQLAREKRPAVLA